MIEVLDKTDLLDLFEKKKLDGIAHQTNSERVMGAGIAKEISKRFPEALDALKGSRGELGEVSFASTPYGWIFNATAQSFKGMGRKTNYEALYQALESIELMCFKKKDGFKLGIPYGIGCGLGGGNWQIVSSMLNVIFENSSTNLIICKKD